MNKYFMKMSIEKVELLHSTSMDKIKLVLKDYNKIEKKSKYEVIYQQFVYDLFSNNLSEKQINAFLHKKFKNEHFDDYIEVLQDSSSKEYSIHLKKYDKVLDLNTGMSLLEEEVYKFKWAVETPIINLITLYEGFIRLLISTDFAEGNWSQIKDEKLSLLEIKNLGYEEKRIQNFIIESYCDRKLYGDNKRIRNVISALEIDCRDCSELIEDFDEIYFRRNMYVHSIERLTTDYLSLPKRILDEWAKEGNKLQVLPKYFEHAFLTLKKIILMILIKKCLFKEKNESDLCTLSDIIYDTYYLNKKYDVACFAYRQLKNLNWINDMQRYIYYINYMVCLKYTDIGKLNMELEKWNTMTDSHIFKLAKKLIQEDYTNINNLIKDIYLEDNEFYKLSNEEKTLHLIRCNIEEWPLFDEYRKTEYYKVLTIL